jgi:hypothetical protein
MPNYRKKPIIVEAVQWFPGVTIDGVREHAPVPYEHHGYGAFTTIHGQVTMINPGDWVIREADGVHWYPCKDDVFRRTYDPIEDSHA